MSNFVYSNPVLFSGDFIYIRNSNYYEYNKEISYPIKNNEIIKATIKNLILEITFDRKDTEAFLIYSEYIRILLNKYISNLVILKKKERDIIILNILNIILMK